MISDAMFQDAAESADPVRNTSTPITSTGLRPKVSASLPYTGIVTVCANR